MLLRRLRLRNRQPEWMDQPDLDPERHRQALRGLERINWLSRSAGILWPAIRDLARSADRPIRVLDLACGAGDVPLAIARKARRACVPVEVAACDISAVAIEHAARRAEREAVDVAFQVRDVFGDELPLGFDVVCCSLFLHHLDEDEAIRLLKRMGEATRRLVLINDLARSVFGYLLAYVGTRLLSRSPIVHVDGPRSVEGAFTPAEAMALAGRAGLAGATAVRRWPARYLLRWSRP